MCVTPSQGSVVGSPFSLNCVRPPFAVQKELGGQAGQSFLAWLGGGGGGCGMTNGESAWWTNLGKGAQRLPTVGGKSAFGKNVGNLLFVVPNLH